MNAMEVLEHVREHDAELFVRDGRLMVRGRGKPLPDDLLREVGAHKVQLLAACGVPLDRIAEEILRDLRPLLAPPLRALPDASLMVLVNWSIIAAFEAAVRKVER